jgi:hypothetical protein
MPAQDIGEQDAHIAGYILEAGKALAVAVNKWDALDAVQRKDVKNELERKLQFLDFAEFRNISARHGTGIKQLLAAVDTAFAAAMAKLSTPKLTRALQAAVEQQQPPMAGRFRPEASIRAPGRLEPAHRRDPRVRDRQYQGPLQALSREHVPGDIQATGNAAPRGAAVVDESLRGKGQALDGEAGRPAQGAARSSPSDGMGKPLGTKGQ